MNTVMLVNRILIGLAGLVLLALGITFWTGHGFSLIPVHVMVGGILVLLVWTMVGLTLRAGVRAMPLVLLAVAFSIIMPLLGVTQASILPGSNHWIVQVAHLLVGFATVGLAQQLARRALGKRASGTEPA